MFWAAHFVVRDSLPRVVIIFPANKRRDSDQYAESRRKLSAAGKQYRTSGTIGSGLDGSQFPEYGYPSASKILWGLARTECSYFDPFYGKISSL